MSNAAVDAARIGPGQLLLAADRIAVGLLFAVANEIFEVVGQPVDIGAGRYLATVRTTTGPKPGSELTAQLQVGYEVPSSN
jgi:hypothetical protein